MTDSLLLLHLSCYFKILNHPNKIGLTRTVEFCAIMHRLIRTAWEWYISSWMCHFFSDILFPFPHNFSPHPPILQKDVEQSFIWEIFCPSAGLGGWVWVYLYSFNFLSYEICDANSCFWSSFNFLLMGDYFLVPLQLSSDFFFAFKTHCRNHKAV